MTGEDRGALFRVRPVAAEGLEHAFPFARGTLFVTPGFEPADAD